MKKRLSLLILIVLTLSAVISLAACGNDGLVKDEGEYVDDKYRNYYEIFVYSYYDTDADGYGDLNGVTKKLDYIKDMGFNGIWLMPIHPSPTYHKYDVSDYYAIDPLYGDLDDFDNLIKEAHARNINVIIDLVVNHTSTSHKWFKDATAAIKRGETDNKYAKYYNFTNTKQDDYTQVAGTNYYYESRFWSGMPDLNLDNDDVRREISDVMKFWLNERNVDGFRLDAVTSYYTGSVSKNVEFLSWLNNEAKSFKEDCYIVAEAWEGTDVQIKAYNDSGIDSCFLFTGTANAKMSDFFSDLSTNPGEEFSDWLLYLQNTYDGHVLAPFLSNHDIGRAANAFGRSRVTRIKMGAGLLAMMNGATFVYYGDEIGMVNAGTSDPNKRIAMLWEEMDDFYEGQCWQRPDGADIVNELSYNYPSVKTQSADETSILNFYKQAYNIRAKYPEIARGTVEKIDCDNKYVSIVQKTYNGKTCTIVINLNPTESAEIATDESWGAMVARLTADQGKVTHIKGNLSLPAYSIAVFR